MKLTMLGTGNALVTECFNTCFLIEDRGQTFMVDGGGGNTIMHQIKHAGYDWMDLRHIFVTHKHVDHLMGIIWMVRMICQFMDHGEYKGEAYIYSHGEVLNLIRNMADKLLQKKESAFIDDRLHLVEVSDGETLDIIDHKFTFFDIQSTKAKQYGFRMELEDGKMLTCCGDEPLTACVEKNAEGSEWMLHEAFCLHSQADIFDPYEKHHSFFVYDIPAFNESVVREAILNAVSHRNYQMAGSVFIRQYHETLIVESPGGLPHGISLDNILDRQVPRNRRIAEILALCGLVERSGQGMNIIYETSIKEAKQLPDFSGTDDNFVNLKLSGLVLDKKMLSLINKIGNERLDSLTTTDFLVINALYYEKPLNNNMRLRLKHLIEMGIVEHVSRNKYVLARSLYSAAGKQGIHTRIVGLDRETNKELLLKHIHDKGDEGAPFKELQQVLPGHNRGQIQVLLRELRKEGRTHCVGNTSAARWFEGPGEEENN